MEGLKDVLYSDIKVVKGIEMTVVPKMLMTSSFMPISHKVNLPLILGQVSLFWKQACSLLDK